MAKAIKAQNGNAILCFGFVLWYYGSSSHYKNWLFESPPTAGFQTTNFGVSSAEGAGNTKIGFIMSIAGITGCSTE